MMQYQRLTDETSVIIRETGESQLWSSSLGANRSVRRLRRIALILLGVQLILCAILLIIDARLVLQGKGDNHRQGIRSFAPIFLSIIYYGCGLDAVYRYHHLGIYAFSWLGPLQYISLCVEVFLNIVSIKQYSPADRETRLGIFIGLTVAIISTFLTVLTVITLKLTFKLLHFIKTFQREVVEQI